MLQSEILSSTPRPDLSQSLSVPRETDFQQMDERSQMMMRWQAGVVALVWMVLGAWVLPSHAAADREKLLSEPGVYGTFAAFTLDEEWAKEDQATRIAHVTVLRGVVEQHREKVAIDLYLMRGLSDHADLMFRGH